MSETDEKLPEQVDAEEARMIVAKGRALVFDIRSADDFAEERINGSVHCEPDEIADRAGDDRAGREAVLVVCEDGKRSAEVAEELRGDGVEASSLKGGFEAWTSESHPTAPTSDEEYEGPSLKLPGAVASEGGDGEEKQDADSGEAEPDAEGRQGRQGTSPKDEKQADEAEA